MRIILNTDDIHEAVKYYVSNLVPSLDGTTISIQLEVSDEENSKGFFEFSAEVSDE